MGVVTACELKGRVQPPWQGQPRPAYTLFRGCFTGGGRSRIRTREGVADGLTVRRRPHQLHASDLRGYALDCLPEINHPGCKGRGRPALGCAPAPERIAQLLGVYREVDLPP